MCKACLYSTPGTHSTPLSDLVFHVFFAKGLGRQKKLSHSDPLIIMTCLELSRHSRKSFISKLVKHDSFSWVHQILKNQQAYVHISSWILDGLCWSLGWISSDGQCNVCLVLLVPQNQCSLLLSSSYWFSLPMIYTSVLSFHLYFI